MILVEEGIFYPLFSSFKIFFFLSFFTFILFISIYMYIWPASWETYMQVRRQQLELGMKQQTSSK